MHPLRFTVPAPDSFRDPNVETNPNQLGKWIEQLPYADPGRVARLILESLSRLNRYPVEINASEELIDLYHKPSIRLLRVAPGSSGAPPSDVLRQLMVEMAYGYKRIINQCLDQNLWLGNRTKLLKGLYYATKHLTMEMLLAFEAYDCRSTVSWREILLLFQFAEQQNLHREVVNDPAQPIAEDATVSHLTKRMILLRLLDPCHLQPGESRYCYDFLNQWASLARLDPASSLTDTAGRFILDMKGAEPPRPLDPENPLPDSDRYRLLNLVPVSKKAHQQLRRLELGGEAPPPGLQQLSDREAAQILRRMLQTWHIRQERQSERLEKYSWILVSPGLSAVHHFICSLQATEDGEDSTTNVELTDVSSTGYGQTPRYERVVCRQINKSQTGVALRMRLPSSINPQVGQLLLLEQENETQSDDEWHTGVIRRCLRLDTDTMEMGVQFLQGVVHAVHLRLLGLPGDSQIFHPALMVNRGNPNLNSVLTSRGLFQHGHRLEVREAVPAAIIIARQLVEVTAGFDRFRFDEEA